VRTLTIITTLAWRNLWRNHRRTLIMLAAVSVGVWAMIFMTALIRGMVNDMLRDGIEALPGLVQVHNPLYRDDPSVNNLLSIDATEAAAALKAAGIEEFSSRVRVPAIVSSERESRGITLVGVDPAEEATIAAIGSEIVAGRGLESADDDGVVLGQALARQLETEVGKRVVIMSQDPDNEVVDRGFRVVGLFTTSLEVQEEAFAFAGRSTVQTLLRIGNGISEIAVMGEDYRNVDPLLAKVRSVMSPDDETLPWTEFDAYLGSMLSVMDGFVLVWIVVVFLALSFGLVNTLVMAVFERVREIGLMLALGMRPASILSQVLIESVFLLAIGLVLGNVLAYASIRPLEGGIDISIVAEGMEMFGASSMLYPDLTLKDVVTANIVVLILGIFASLSPAWRASRYEPVRALTRT
jgi:ABC-type lipoprotein release transport system permease subunit